MPSDWQTRKEDGQLAHKEEDENEIINWLKQIMDVVPGFLS